MWSFSLSVMRKEPLCDVSRESTLRIYAVEIVPRSSFHVFPSLKRLATLTLAHTHWLLPNRFKLVVSPLTSLGRLYATAPLRRIVSVCAPLSPMRSRICMAASSSRDCHFAWGLFRVASAFVGFSHASLQASRLRTPDTVFREASFGLDSFIAVQ